MKQLVGCIFIFIYLFIIKFAFHNGDTRGVDLKGNVNMGAKYLALVTIGLL